MLQRNLCVSQGFCLLSACEIYKEIFLYSPLGETGRAPRGTIHKSMSSHPKDRGPQKFLILKLVNTQPKEIYQNYHLNIPNNLWDGGAWWAAVYGVAQSRTRLKQLSSMLSLCCFSGVFLVAMHGLLVAVASLVPEHGL